MTTKQQEELSDIENNNEPQTIGKRVQFDTETYATLKEMSEMTLLPEDSVIGFAIDFLRSQGSAALAEMVLLRANAIAENLKNGNS